MGKLTISMAMFNSYAKLLEGKYVLNMIIIIFKNVVNTIITVDIGKQHYIENNDEQMLVNIRHS